MPEEQAPDAAAKPSKGMFKIIVVLIVILVAAVAGFVTYKFILAPMLQDGDEQPPTEEISNAIPPTAVAYDFDEAQAAVRSDDPAAGSSILMYTVSLICANPETMAIIDKNKQWFVSKLAEIHRGRTKAELNDPQVEKEITRLALEESNSLLRRLQQPPNPEIRVIEVLHLKFAVFDL